MRTTFEIVGVTALAVLCWHAIGLWMLVSESQGLGIAPYNLASAASRVAGLVVLVAGARWLGQHRALRSPRLVGTQFAVAGLIFGGIVTAVRFSLVDPGYQFTTVQLATAVASEAVVDAALSLVSGLAGVPLGAMAAGDEDDVMEGTTGADDADATHGSDPGPTDA